MWCSRCWWLALLSVSRRNVLGWYWRLMILYRHDRWWMMDDGRWMMDGVFITPLSPPSYPLKINKIKKINSILPFQSFLLWLGYKLLLTESSIIHHPSIPHQSSSIHTLSHIIKYPSHIIHHPPFTIHHPSSTIHHPSSIIHHPHPSSTIHPLLKQQRIVTKIHTKQRSTGKNKRNH